jgi:hypothetical protein
VDAELHKIADPVLVSIDLRGITFDGNYQPEGRPILLALAALFADIKARNTPRSTCGETHYTAGEPRYSTVGFRVPRGASEG